MASEWFWGQRVQAAKTVGAKKKRRDAGSACCSTMERSFEKRTVDENH